MFHLCHVDPVVVLVRPDPFDPDNTLLEIDRHDQPVCVALHVENDALGRHDARGGIGPLHLGRACPARLLRLIEPSIQGGFHRRLMGVRNATEGLFRL